MDKLRAKQTGDLRRIGECLVPAIALGCATAHGQQVFVPSVDYGSKIPTVEQASMSQIGSVAAPPLRRASPLEAYPLNWGPIRFHPHLSYQLVHGDGVLSDTNGPQTTLLHTLSPGAFFELGRYWDFDFTASFNHYSNAEFSDSAAYSAALRGNVPLEKWLLSLSYIGSLTEQPQVESGTQTLQNSQRVAVGGVYNYNTRFSVELGLSQEALLTEDFSDYWTWSTTEWLNYHVTQKTSVAFGVGGGYNLVDPGVDWTFERLQGRLVWQPGPKLNLQMSGGAQFQQFTGSSPDSDDASESLTSPVFGAVVSYQPVEPTVISLSAGHEIGNSFLTGLYSETTTVSGGIRQRLFRHLSASVQPTYIVRNYKSTPGSFSEERDDDYFSVYAGVNALLLKKLNVTVFYQFTDNSSSMDQFSFESTQVGVRLDYRY